jgi:putative superfamily III holin-X
VSRDVDLASGEREKRQESVPEKGKKAGLGVGMFGGAALLGMAVVGGSMATIIILLDLAMPLWLASLVTTILYGAAAALLALRGRDELKETGAPIPERTKQSVKEDIQWAKTRAQSKDR